MKSKVQNVLLGVVFVAFLISNIILIKSNLRLKEELIVANNTIVELQKTAFHDDSMVADSSSAEIILYNYAQPKKSSGASNLANPIKPISSNSTPGISLLDLKGKYLDKSAPSDFTLFIFFSPTDCPTCLLEAPVWQRLHTDVRQLSLQVIGVMFHPDRVEGEHFLKNLGVTFPVLFDKTALLKHKYRIGETPEKILIDSEGKTQLIASGSKSEQERRAFEKSVLKLLPIKTPH